MNPLLKKVVEKAYDRGVMHGYFCGIGLGLALFTYFKQNKTYIPVRP